MSNTKIDLPNGLFITIEGAEGAGKSTQAKRLKAWFEERGYEVVLVSEPGGTPFGLKMREVFLAMHQDLVPEAEVALLVAAKAQLLHTVIIPALDAGKVVICDRYTDTLYAYQHHAKGHDRSLIKDLVEAANTNLETNFTYLLDITPELSVQRSNARKNQGGEFSSIDAAPLEFHKRVIEGLRYEICDADRNYIVVSAEKSEDEVHRVMAETAESVLYTIQKTREEIAW